MIFRLSCAVSYICIFLSPDLFTLYFSLIMFAVTCTLTVKSYEVKSSPFLVKYERKDLKEL